MCVYMHISIYEYMQKYKYNCLYFFKSNCVIKFKYFVINILFYGILLYILLYI